MIHTVDMVYTIDMVYTVEMREMRGMKGTTMGNLLNLFCPMFDVHLILLEPRVQVVLLTGVWHFGVDTGLETGVETILVSKMVSRPVSSL